MDAQKILSADVLDIVFEGRNKDYGAYQLRKTYHKRITCALAGTLVTCALLLVGSVIANRAQQKKPEMLVQDVSLENIQPEEKKAEPPPPPPPPLQKPPQVEVTRFTPPKIVQDEEVEEKDEIKDMEKLADTKIGNVDREGTKDEGILAPPVETGTGVVAAPQEDEIDKVFTVVQIPAEFPGGLPAWSKFLERNLNRDLPVENGAPPGRYTVIVSFIVAKDGRISDVTAENDPGYGTKAEAMRVIQKGPSWKPAVQNGRNVIYRHKQSITFQVAEE